MLLAIVTNLLHFRAHKVVMLSREVFVIALYNIISVFVAIFPQLLLLKVKAGVGFLLVRTHPTI